MLHEKVSRLKNDSECYKINWIVTKSCTTFNLNLEGGCVCLFIKPILGFNRYYTGKAKFMQQVYDEILSKVSDDFLALFKEVIASTPVDTGAAKAHHGLENRQFIKTHTLATPITKSMVFKKLNQDSLELVNNTPYIGKLENGGSRQAPIGFYAINILRFEKQHKNE